MKDTIFYVGGGKGGVGKSMVSMTLVQFLIDKYGESKTIHLIETDDSNPDVWRVYRGRIPVSTAMLDENEKGWILMSELIETRSDTLLSSTARPGATWEYAKTGETSRRFWRAGKYRIIS
jgi:hypothetical protein